MDDNLGLCTLLEAINNKNSVGCWTLIVGETCIPTHTLYCVQEKQVDYM